MYLKFLSFPIKSKYLINNFIIFHLLKPVEQKKSYNTKYRDRSREIKIQNNPKYSTLDWRRNITVNMHKITLEIWLSLLLTDRLVSPGTVLPATPQEQVLFLEQHRLLLAVILLGYSLSYFPGEIICKRNRDIIFILQTFTSPKERNSMGENNYYYYYFIKIQKISGLLVCYLCTGY